ncbi:hypothetical protein BJV82DRAFT_644186 [Fennellomyces sp. T-0311]|nr:hypothetical protein BJV82DRAFT_644186 [Fennellomyces sp. T-0311]
MATTSKLFQPIKLGASQLKHRVVLAPMTRVRADTNRVPTDLLIKHYEQRATDGGLLITEGTLISPTSGGTPNVPGLYNEEQITGWKKVTDAVHAKGGIIYNQLWHQGRTTYSMLLPNNAKPVAPSAIAIPGKDMMMGGIDYEVPHALTVEEIASITQDYTQAAKNAIKAGFDGIEIHGATGYLVDQFLNTSSNARTDQYGGSIENRSRFGLELVESISKEIGEDRTSIRLSPFGGFQGMKDDTPYETWGYFIEELQKRHPNLAYIHMVEPRTDLLGAGHAVTEDSLDPFRAKWSGAFISGGGYSYSQELAREVADSTGNLIAFGRTYTSNPDLVERLKNGWPLTPYDRSTFYTNHTGAQGYTDWANYDPTAQQ